MVWDILQHRLFSGITRKWCHECAKNFQNEKLFSKGNFLFEVYIVSAVSYSFTINSSQKTSQTILLLPYGLREVLHFLQCYNAHQCAMVVKHTTDGSDSRTTKSIFLQKSRPCYMIITILTVFPKKSVICWPRFSTTLSLDFITSVLLTIYQKQNGLQKTILCSLPPRFVCYYI